MQARLGEHATVTCTRAPDVSDGGRTSLTPTSRTGADQPPRGAAAFAVGRGARRVGRAAGGRVAVLAGRGDAVGRAVARGVVRGVACGAVRVVVAVDADAEGAVGVGEVDVVGVGRADDKVAAGSCADGAGPAAVAVDDAVVVADELLLGYVVTWSPISASDHDVDAEGVGVASVTVAVGARLVRIPKTAPPTSIAVPAITRPRGVSCTTCSPVGLARPTASRPMH